LCDLSVKPEGSEVPHPIAAAAHEPISSHRPRNMTIRSRAPTNLTIVNVAGEIGTAMAPITSNWGIVMPIEEQNPALQQTVCPAAFRVSEGKKERSEPRPFSAYPAAKSIPAQKLLFLRFDLNNQFCCCVTAVRM
jgi:hypothetical protein